MPGTHLPQHPCNGQHDTRWSLRHMCKSAFTIVIHTWDKVQELRSQAHCCPRWERYVGPIGVQCGANRCAWTKDHPELCLTASSATEGSHAPHEAAAAPRVQGMCHFAKHCSRSTRSCRRRRRGQGSAGGGSRGTQGRRSHPQLSHTVDYIQHYWVSRPDRRPRSRGRPPQHLARLSAEPPSQQSDREKLCKLDSAVGG